MNHMNEDLERESATTEMEVKCKGMCNFLFGESQITSPSEL